MATQPTVAKDDEEKNPYLDSDVLTGSTAFTPDSNDTFIQQHSDSNGIASDSSKGSGFVVVDGKPNGPIAPIRHPSPHLSIDEDEDEDDEENEEEEKYEYVKRKSHASNNDEYHEYVLYSVESGLHALLTTLNLPIHSHVLITSLVSPSIKRIIELHGLIAKPIDIDLESMTPSTSIQQLITKQTKLIIVRHLFGFTIPIHMANSDSLNDILIIEDCSDLDTDSNCEYSDVKMYSLNGSNSSNGAMFTFKDKTLLQRLQNITNTYRKQSAFTYLCTLMACYLWAALSHKYITKIFVTMCHILCIDYNESRASNTTTLSTKQFMSCLELQPCSSLIKRMKKRGKTMNKKDNEIMNKKRSAVLSSLTAITDVVIVGKSCDVESNAESFPVLMKDRNDRSRVIRDMRYLGYNVSASAVNTSNELMAIQGSSNGNYFLSNVLYLPVRALKLKSFERMLSDFNKVINNEKSTHKTRSGVLSSATLQLVMKILMVIVVLRYIWFYLCITWLISYYFLRPTKKFRDTPYMGVKHKRVCSKTKITALITGSTGFLGEVLVKDLLDSYPSHLIKLYLIVRGKKRLSAQERARQLFGDIIDNDAICVVIDAELDTLDIEDINVKERITHVIHSAGNVKFNDAHSNIANTNISCSLKMKKLADKYKAKYIYISTAFVHGADSTKNINHLNASAKWLPDNDLSAEELFHLMLGDRPEVDQYMKRNHIENNYVLSKMVSENLIGSTSVIIRPSIISPSWNFPEPGWGGRTPSTVTVIAAGVAARLLRCTIYSSLTISKPMPVVPVDFVTKCLIDHMDSNDGTIYLAALNTETKYNKVCSMYEAVFVLSSYFHSMEIITGAEAVLVRLTLILSSFSIYLFRFLGYILNELFAPNKYKHILLTIYQYRHFSSTGFHVTNGITPHSDFDGKKYTTIIGEAAAHLIKKPISDLTSNIPFKFDKNLMISIVNTCLTLILRKTTNKVTVDTDKLKELSSAKNIVLLPTHRSFYDFLLICKLCVKYKMYGLSMPLSFATSKFKQSPLIAMCMGMMNTIFIDAGSNNIRNGFLRKKINQNKDKNNVYQLFIEGTRSRNRQFLKAHHGVLSTLAETMDLCIVPITINYERVPEQNAFYRELDGEKSSFSAIDLLGWLYDVIFKNNIFLGDIHINIGDMIEVKQREYDKEYFSNLVNHIQLKQMEMVHITSYHIHHFKKQKQKHQLRIANIEEFLKQTGCDVYPTSIHLNEITMNDKDVYMNTLQFAHFLADYMDLNTKVWLTNGNILSKSHVKISGEQKEFVQSIVTIIDRYRTFNYMNQSMTNLSISDASSSPAHASTSLRVSVGEESLGYWGYSDSYFQLKDDKLFFKGSRYEISDKYLNGTISFLSKLSNIPLLRKRKCFPVLNHEKKEDVCTSESDDELMSFLNTLFGVDHINTNINTRYRHGTGHTVSDMLHLRIADTSFRVPDIVVYPTSSSQIVQLVQNCDTFNVCLIPYGGGTNVTHALWCSVHEKRKIISVDMSLMNKVIWMNRENQTAHVMSGITGKKLESELNSCGFTTGHYPDSYEFSTLGGWIATFASGMKRTKYGNIEEIVIDFEVVTASGLIRRNVVYGRVAAGTNPLSVFFGSEGTLGIIVSAVVRLHKIPDIISYDSILFPNWSQGINMMKMVRNIAANCRPASLRLVDNTQFKLSQTFKEKHKSSFLSKLYVTKWKGFDLETVCAATIVYEGTQNEINIQKNIINKLISQNKGIRGGQASGKAGFNLTFAIAYIRDFMLETFGILAESFETFIPWDKVDNFKPKLHDSIVRKHKSMGLIGNPFLSSRISQVYNEGVCLYLYYGFYVESINRYSFTIFDEMEDFIRKQMLAYGASISHHHGIGKLRADILKNDISSKQMIDLTRNLKHSFDPNNIFCANNGLCAE